MIGGEPQPSCGKRYVSINVGAKSGLLRWCWQRAPWRLAGNLALLSLSAVLGIGALLLFAPLFDRGIIPGNFATAASILLLQLFGFLGGGGLAAAAFHLFSSYGANLAAALTLRTYQHLQSQSFTSQLHQGQSELLHLLRGDIAIIEGSLSQLLWQGFVAALQILVVLGLMLAWHLPLFWLALVKNFNLEFGAIDLILTPQGEYVFLEINPSGQFAWVETLTKLPLVDTLADLLLSHT
jgi:ABC-type multidrug transport system fused ATPase/permease subunit